MSNAQLGDSDQQDARLPSWVIAIKSKAPGSRNEAEAFDFMVRDERIELPTLAV